MRHTITPEKQMLILNMRDRILRTPNMIGKLITFEGVMRGNRRAGVQRHSDVVVGIGHSKRGRVYHTAKGIKVPESLIVDFCEPTQDQIPKDDLFARHERMKDKMRELVGRQITWDSQRTGQMMTMTAIRCGKRRLTCIEPGTTMKWFVPLNLIRKVDGEPWSYKD